MAFEFRPAVRESVGLLIGLAGGTGSGKTYSAMSLAKGMSGGKPFAVIDTEAGRAKHYADEFRFDHGALHPPFTPDAYAEAIKAADAAGYPVIVVDSMSHEHAGDGGLLDWHETELERMAGSDWKKREQCTMAAWIKPKMSHKHMVQKLLQVKAHLILCFRAEEKIEMVRGDNGKMQIIKKQTTTGLDGWVPISEKNLPYELTASFLLIADAPGMPKPIKLQRQHRSFFPLDSQINESCGANLAAWAAGGATPKATDYAAALNAAATIDELGKAWSAIPKAEQKKYVAVKDARKAALSQPASLSDRIAACKTVAELDALSETLSEDDAAIYFDAVARRKGELVGDL